MMNRGAATLRCLLAGVAAVALMNMPASAQQQNRPNVVMLMTDDTGWNDFGAYSGGGRALGHPTPNIDRIAKEGATFTNWYGQASCTAGRACPVRGGHPAPFRHSALRIPRRRSTMGRPGTNPRLHRL